MKKIKNARDRITDKDVQKAYDKYKNYLLELQVYEAYGDKANKINIFKLASLYKRNGIDVKNKKELVARFETFCSTIETIKQKNPDVDLKNIRTQEGRNIVSDVIYETRER